MNVRVPVIEIGRDGCQRLVGFVAPPPPTTEEAAAPKRARFDAGAPRQDESARRK